MDDLAERLREIETSSGPVAKGRVIAAMREQGSSWRQIAAAAGRSHSTIRYWYQKYLGSTQVVMPTGVPPTETTTETTTR